MSEPDPSEIMLSLDEIVIYTGLSRETVRFILRQKLRGSVLRASVVDADWVIAWERRRRQRAGPAKYQT